VQTGVVDDHPMNFGRVVGAGVAGLGLVGAGYAGLAGHDDTVRNESGQVVEAGEVGAFRIRLGDCLAATPDGDFESVQAVPCADPHASEVYAAFMLPAGDYPGDAQVDAMADEGCYDRVGNAIDLSLGLDDYGLSSITPRAEGWNEIDDREVLCLVGRIDGGSSTGSVRL